jgi:hypothetical protein
MFLGVKSGLHIRLTASASHNLIALHNSLTFFCPYKFTTSLPVIADYTVHLFPGQNERKEHTEFAVYLTIADPFIQLCY